MKIFFHFQKTCFVIFFQVRKRLPYFYLGPNLRLFWISNNMWSNILDHCHHLDAHAWSLLVHPGANFTSHSQLFHKN